MRGLIVPLKRIAHASADGKTCDSVFERIALGCVFPVVDVLMSPSSLFPENVGQGLRGDIVGCHPSESLMATGVVGSAGGSEGGYPIEWTPFSAKQ